MEKFIVPTYIEYNACQLTYDNLDNFKNFISKYSYSYGAEITYKTIGDKNYPIEINFKWNPHCYDYVRLVRVQFNQYFIYEKDEPDNWKVLDPEEISDEWYTYIEN